MPIVATIGRKHLKVRLLFFTFYLVLILGAATMVYPFLLMLGGSMRSSVDVADRGIVPRFLYDDTALYQKYIEGLFNESLQQARHGYDIPLHSFSDLQPPQPVSKALLETWESFIQQNHPSFFFARGFMETPHSRNVFPHRLQEIIDQEQQHHHGDIEAFNRKTGADFEHWNHLRIKPTDATARRFKPATDPFHHWYQSTYKINTPPAERYYVNQAGFYRRLYLRNTIGDRIETYNQRFGTSYPNWKAVPFPSSAKEAAQILNEKEFTLWLSFVREIANAIWVQASPEATLGYQAYLKAKYETVTALNAVYKTSVSSFNELTLPRFPKGIGLSDWEQYVTGWTHPKQGTTYQLPASSIRLTTVTTLFRAYVKQHEPNLYTPDLEPPHQAFHYAGFLEKKDAMRMEFATRNYRSVWSHLVIRGHAMWNTVIYCFLAVFSALLVNPLAAYALSRYRLSSSYTILMFLMLTMSFPPIVTQIPTFIMLRDFQLLNTFWALILPGLAHGYSIFLLKGFFDSLPTELYESAELDGAGEFRIFWGITMTLSKPILAVIALNAFTQAYSNFMYALLICQDERMWTIMPFLYQLQSKSGTGIIYASLIIASIPTLIVFTLCQNIIMRGIVVPVEK